jgi:hypothetical protein
MESTKAKPVNLDVMDFIRRERMALLSLNEQERKFCEGYVRHFDKKLAYSDAGYKTTLFTGAPIPEIEKDIDELISREDISVYLLLLRESVASRIGVSLDLIVEEYRRMAFAKMEDYVSWNANGLTFLRSSDQLTEAQRAGVMEISETTSKAGGKTMKIKLFPKQAALDRLFELLKELEDRDDSSKNKKISNVQVNMILQDPMMRRAIEHLATGMFSRQVLLVSDDKDATEFNKHLANMTRGFQEVVHGQGAGGRGGVREIATSEDDGGSGGREDGGVAGRSKKATDPGRDGLIVKKVKKVGASPGVNQEDGDGSDTTEVDDAGRYGFPGL